MIQQLIADIRDALHHIPADAPRASLLKEVLGSLNRHAEFLSENPVLLFQCLWNDLATSQPNPLLTRWRETKQQVSPRFYWLERLSQPPLNAPAREVQILSGHENIVMRTVFSPDGTKLATCGADNTIILWDVEFGIRLLRIAAHEGDVTSIAFLPNGDLLSGSVDRSIKLWNADTGELLQHFHGLTSWSSRDPLPLNAHAGPVTGICLFRDGKRFVSSAGDTGGTFSWKDRTARIWDLDTGKEVRRYVGHEGPVWGVGLNHDESLLATCSSDGTVRIWPTARSDKIHALSHDSVIVGSLCWHLTQNVLWSGDAAGLVYEWDCEEGRLIRTFQIGDSPVTCIAAHPAGADLLVSTLDGRCELVRLANGEHRLVAKFSGAAYGVSWSPDGNSFACGSANYTASITRIDVLADIGASELLTDSGDTNNLRKRIELLAFTPDGENLALVRQTSISSYELRTRQEHILEGKHEGHISDLCTLKDGLIATASYDRTIRIWSIPLGQTTHILTHNQMVTSLAYSIGGLLASGSYDKLVRIWNPVTGDLVRSFAGHQTPVHDVAFSHDGKLLVSASGGEGAQDDNSVRVWDVESGKELYCLRGHISPVYAVGISPDGEFVASGSGYGVFSEFSDLILWDLETGNGRRIASFEREKRIIEIAFSTYYPIVMTRHDREYGELGEGVDARTGNRYVTRFWDLNEFALYREFDAEIDIGRGIAQLGDGDWLGVAEATRFYAQRLKTFQSLAVDERVHLVAHHPTLPIWASADGDNLVICVCRQG